MLTDCFPLDLITTCALNKANKHINLLQVLHLVLIRVSNHAVVPAETIGQLWFELYIFNLEE